MTVFLGAHNLGMSFGAKTLFEDLCFMIIENDRIGLIGPNGSGKSTLCKILAGVEDADSGYVSKKQGLRVGYASQDPVFPDASLEEVLLQASPNLTKARILLSKAQFTDFTVNASTLSGGWKKRLDILRAMMTEPDLLILDEPTNHLDLAGILWLEQFLSREVAAYLVVSHDRYFLENITNKVIEINPCFPKGLMISEGNMSDFMTHKEAFLKAQAEEQRSLAGVVRQEVDWLRTSPRARTTKSTARIKKAYELIDSLSEVKTRNTISKVSLEFNGSERETRKLLTGVNITKSLGNKQLFKGLNITLSPGTRLGIVGENGTGKTTLLKILAQQIALDKGTLKYAQDLQLVYFDQHREQIHPDTTIREALCPHADYVNYRGQEIHVNGWAKKFLFSQDRLSLPVRCLSGGEKARIQIAHLMLKPADILFLDEPTNDLDIPTLEIIEESLKEFPGAVVLISHDRCLMDRVCNQIIGLGADLEEHHFADYNQWEEAKRPAPTQVKNTKASPKIPIPKKLSYLEKKELEGMEDAIMAAEALVEDLHKKLENPTPDLYTQVEQAQNKLDALYDRWQHLLNK